MVLSKEQVTNVVNNLELRKRLTEHVANRTAHNSTEDPAFFVEVLVLDILNTVERLESDLEEEVNRAVSSEIENNLELVGKDDIKEFVERQEIETMIEDALDEYDRRDDAIDPDDFVKADDLEEEIKNVLEDTDVIQNAAKGAVIGAMAGVRRIVDLQEDLKVTHALAESAMARLDALNQMGFWTRLKFAFGGKF